MSHKSKRIVASIIAGIAAIAAYFIKVLGPNAPAHGDIKEWALCILVFIGIGVIAVIGIQIVFHIVLTMGRTIKADKETYADLIEDEMDKLISLKAGRVGYGFAGVGIVAGIISLACGASIIPALHIMLGVLVLGQLIEGIVSIFYYEKGVRNG